MIKPWKKRGSKSLGDFRIFTIRSDQAVSPRTGAEHEVFIIDCVNWVNIIATTPDERLVMVEQYRHGTDTIELEIPGGMMDAGDVSPIATGLRELKEETGYEGKNEKAEIIGKIFPNPAIMSNTTFTVLVENCALKHAPVFDDGEDLVTRLVPISEIPNLMAEGKIRHALVAVALFHFDLRRREKLG
jgi:ADP-ribose pyrophosphatase